VKRIGLVIVLCVVYVTPGWSLTPEQRKATVAFLQNLQQPDGGFLPVPDDSRGNVKTSVRATTTALRALKYMGGEPKDKMGCAKFLRSCFDAKTGGFADHPGGLPDVNSTSAGIMGIVELGLPVQEYSEPVVRYLEENAKNFEDIRIAAAALESIQHQSRQSGAWLEVINRNRLSDGTYSAKAAGRARATGGAVVAVLRLGGTVQDANKVAQVLREGQGKDGGFGKEDSPGSDLESTYRVVRAFVMLKKKPDVQGCRTFVESCRNKDGGYGLTPGAHSSAPTTYFASIILHWLKEMDQ